MATISRLLKIAGLLCRISSFLYGSFAKEAYKFKEPTNRSHPMGRNHDRSALPSGKMIGLLCKKALQKRRYSAKETCNFKDL